MRPELLTTESLRDYVLALPQREQWISLGQAYAPRQLMADFAGTPCDLYVVPRGIADDPVADTPAEVLALNQKFFCTDNIGLTPRQSVWWIEPTYNLPYPALYRIDFKSWHEMHMNRVVNGQRLGKLWWNHPARRRYDRLVIVPRGGDE